MEPAPSVGPALTVLMLESLFRISKSGLETEPGVSDQLILVGVLVLLEVESEGHPTKEGEVGSEKVELLHTGLDRAFYGERLGSRIIRDATGWWRCPNRVC